MDWQGYVVVYFICAIVTVAYLDATDADDVYPLAVVWPITVTVIVFRSLRALWKCG